MHSYSYTSNKQYARYPRKNNKTHLRDVYFQLGRLNIQNTKLMLSNDALWQVAGG